MDIPIKFKFFDKLKLYQDYLKTSSMLEKTKDQYWLCEKSIMLWGYSKKHQHLGIPLGIDTFAKKERANIISKIAEKIGGNNYGAVEWVGNNIRDKIAVQRVIENLITLELVTKAVDNPNGITINLKGFLLGELLSETYENPGFWSKNFRKYKLALLTFYTTFTTLLLTVYLVFLEQLFQLIKPESFLAIGIYIGRFLGYSWWPIITTGFLVYLGLIYIWKKLL